MPCESISLVANKMHNIALELSSSLMKVQKRFNYVTPSTFLDLLLTFKELVTMRKKQLNEQKLGYDKGIEKLIFTAEEVAKMRADLSEKQPKLQEMVKQTEELMSRVQHQAEEVVQPQRKIIAEEEAKTNQRFLQADSIKNECRQELAVAKPMVDAAIAALNTIKPQDIQELRSLLKPPVVIRKVLHAVCIMCQVQPIKTPSPDHPKELEVNWWETARKLMGQKDFLPNVIHFDKDHIPEHVMENIRSNFLPDPDFKPSRAKQASLAAKGLCQWIRALDKYDIVAKQVAPKRQKAKQSQKAAKEAKRILKLKQDQLRQVVQKLHELQQQLDMSAKKRKNLELDIQSCKLKITRACTLLDSLGGQRIRWTEISKEIQKSLDTLMGDSLLCSSVIVYLGPFPTNYREQAVTIWKQYIQQEHSEYLPLNTKFNFTSCIGSMIQAREWHLNSLPTDSLSFQNALIIKHSRKWPLLIDPQSQGNKWIKRQHHSFHRFSVVRLTDRDKLRTFQNCIQFGIPLLLENIPEQVDSVLEPILAKQIFKNAGVQSIKLGENIIEYSKDFKLFITTKMQNPHFLPRLSAKVTLINFSITEHGLRDQILDLIIQRQRPKLEDEKNHLIIQSYEFNKQLRDVEQKILQILRTTGANILQNEKAIQILQESQNIAYETKNKQKAAFVTKKQIDKARSCYEPASGYASMLYFTIRMISKVNVIYQFSLPWYLNILQSALQKSKRSDQVEERVQFIKKQLLAMTFENIMRSMFEKDKLLFSYLLTVKSQLFYGEIEKQNFILLAQRWNMIEMTQYREVIQETEHQNTCSNWLSDQKWLRLRYLQNNCIDKATNTLSKLQQNFETNSSQWQIIYREGILKENMHMLFQDSWPRLSTNSVDINKDERLLIIKAIAPNKIKSSIRIYIQKFMGRQFIEPPTFDLDASYEGSFSNIPLIFVLPGNQPLGPLSNFAKIKRKLDSLKKISLGQGTGPRAQKAIDDAKKNGHWVLLQNCHLAPSWMPNLQKIVESFEGKPPNRQGSSVTQLKPSPNKGKRDSIISTSLSGKQSQIHPSFRLWLTTYSSDSFPQLVLQNSIKIVNQPPIGLKANLISSYTLSDSINDPVKFQLHPYPLFWKRLLFSLCSFHALIQQRIKYGSLGWNEIYHFTHSDLQISILQLYKQLQAMPQLQFQYIPWKALHYLTGQCNYGGRITDEHDRKLLNSLLKDMYSSGSLQRDANIRGLKQFPFPGDQMGYVQTMDFICNKFPITQPAELFGFSSNADIVKDINQGKAMCEALFSLCQDINSSSLLNKQRQCKGQQQLEESQEHDEEEVKEQMQSDLIQIQEQQQEQEIQTSKRKLILINSSQNKQQDNIEQLEQIKENNQILKLIKDVQQKIKDSKFDLQTLLITHPIQYEDSINTILHHQLERYNSLLKVIEDSIQKVQRVIMGQIQTTNEIEEVTSELKSNKTPKIWLKRSYPSIKPLGSYISDLKQRLDMFKFWIEHGKPNTYWFSGFFFPQSFLTAILQGYSRSRKCPIDELEFGFDFEAMNDEISNSNDYPREMYAKKRERNVQGETKIFGLYLEGASWNEMFRQIEQSAPEILHVRMPVIEITVSRIKKKNRIDIRRGDNDDNEIMPMSYDCPVYLTQERRKKIATYSYSQNHVINITVPAAKPGDHWLKRGVALVCQISD